MKSNINYRKKCVEAYCKQQKKWKTKISNNEENKTYLRTIYDMVLCIYVGEVLMVMHTKLLYQRNINMQL